MPREDADLEALAATAIKSTLPKPAKALPPARIARHLTPEDLTALTVTDAPRPPALPAPSNAIIRMKTAHHHLARVMAEGHTNTQASALTGFSVARIATLSQDPAFQELTAYYRQQHDIIYQNAHEKLAMLASMAAEELTQRLEEDPTDFKTRELMEIMNAGYDRSVAPVKSGPQAARGTDAPPVTIAVNFVSPSGATPPTIDITPESEP